MHIKVTELTPAPTKTQHNYLRTEMRKISFHKHYPDRIAKNKNNKISKL